MIPVLQKFALPHATAIALFVAYGELAIGVALILGILVRPASICGLIYMLSLLFSSNYPGPHAAFWQYFGASLDHSVLALCFAALIFGEADRALSIRSYWPLIVGQQETSATRTSPKSGTRNREMKS
jgi:thiosulfate dehydrogenase [quinone] large subunit